jgi:hypothetical protein
MIRASAPIRFPAKELSAVTGNGSPIRAVVVASGVDPGCMQLGLTDLTPTLSRLSTSFQLRHQMNFPKLHRSGFPKPVNINFSSFPPPLQSYPSAHREKANSLGGYQCQPYSRSSVTVRSQ